MWVWPFLFGEEGLPGQGIDVTRHAQRRVSWVAISAVFLAGCSNAPSQAILGSYFPSWMICALIGIAATVLVRLLLVAGGLDKALPAPLIVYLALVAGFAFAAWLLWLE